MKYITILFSIIIISCSSTQETTSTKEISYKTIKAFSDSGFETPVTKVITSKSEFTKVWKQAMAHFGEAPEMPTIDFEKNQVLLIALGVKNNGGYKLQMDKVVENKNSIVVNYFENKPETNCVTTQAIVFPYELIEIPKNSKKIEFVKTEKVVDCK